MARLFEKNSISYLFALMFLINCNLLVAQNLTWKQPLHAGNDNFSIEIDSSNYIYSLCETSRFYPGSKFFDTIPVSSTLIAGSSVFITKTDTSNNLQWMRVIETPWNITYPTLKISPSQNVIVSGVVFDRLICDSIDISFPVHEKPPFFIVQFDPQGNFKWINLIVNDDYNVDIADIAFDSENNIYFIGNTYGSITFGNLDSLGQLVPDTTLSGSNLISSFIAKYSQDGIFLSAKSLPVVYNQGGGYIKLRSLIIDTDDNIYATGYLSGALQYDSSIINSDGIEILLIKFNKKMEIVWSKLFGSGGGSIIQQGQSLAFDKSKKNFYLTGNFIGKIDFGNGPVQSNDKNIFLAKYSLDGRLKWFKNFGCWSGAASYTEEGKKIYVDDDDFVYIGGEFFNTLQIGDTAIEVYIEPNVANSYCDIFVAKFFANGDFSWVTHAGSIGNDKFGSIAKDKYNHVFVGGYSQIGAIFGDYTIIAPPQSGSLGFLACFNDRPEVNKYETSFGIDEWKNVTDRIKVFPNPFINNIEVHIQNTEYSDVSIQLIDLNGKALFSNTDKSRNIIQKFSYQFNNEPSGIYCLKIIIGDNVYTQKIVKQ